MRRLGGCRTAPISDTNIHTGRRFRMFWMASGRLRNNGHFHFHHSPPQIRLRPAYIRILDIEKRLLRNRRNRSCEKWQLVRGPGKLSWSRARLARWAVRHEVCTKNILFIVRSSLLISPGIIIVLCMHRWNAGSKVVLGLPLKKSYPDREPQAGTAEEEMHAGIHRPL